jgi:hypothetical protein
VPPAIVATTARKSKISMQHRKHAKKSVLLFASIEATQLVVVRDEHRVGRKDAVVSHAAGGVPCVTTRKKAIESNGVGALR